MNETTARTVTYKGREYTIRDDVPEVPTAAELDAADRTDPVKVAMWMLICADIKTGTREAPSGLAALFLPPLSPEERRARNWSFSALGLTELPTPDPEDGVAYDGSSCHPQRRELTPKERDILCRMIHLVAGDDRWDGEEIGRLLIIANVVNPRED